MLVRSQYELIGGWMRPTTDCTRLRVQRQRNACMICCFLLSFFIFKNICCINLIFFCRRVALLAKLCRVMCFVDQCSIKNWSTWSKTKCTLVPLDQKLFSRAKSVFFLFFVLCFWIDFCFIALNNFWMFLERFFLFLIFWIYRKWFFSSFFVSLPKVVREVVVFVSAKWNVIGMHLFEWGGAIWVSLITISLQFDCLWR